jgi:tRNA threonylcarbamoyladenosine biosynthesis protein TsaE
MYRHIDITRLDQLEPAALQLLKETSPARIFLFRGAMGAGKTTFVKSLCKVLGVLENTSSPTYSLVNEYRDKTNSPVFHFDFYRIRADSEACDMGFEEYLDSGAWCFIEWPERVEALLPPDCVSVLIELSGQERRISFSVSA